MKVLVAVGIAVILVIVLLLWSMASFIEGLGDISGIEEGESVKNEDATEA